MTVLVSAADVSQAVRSTLEQHLPAQLAALPRPLPPPTSYAEVPTSDAVRRVQGAVLAVSVPGMTDRPRRHGDGSYDASWLLSVAVFHENTPAMPLLTAAADYAAAIRAVLLQRPQLGGLASSVQWTAESLDLVGDATSDRTLGLGVVEFTVDTPGVVSDQPAVDGPQLQSVEVTTVPLALPGP